MPRLNRIAVAGVVYRHQKTHAGDGLLRFRLKLVRQVGNGQSLGRTDGECVPDPRILRDRRSRSRILFRNLSRCVFVRADLTQVLVTQALLLQGSLRLILGLAEKIRHRNHL